MEGLIVLFAELLLAPLILAVSLTFELIVTIVSILIQVLFRKRVSTGPEARSALKAKIAKWTFRASGGLVALTLLSILVINLFFLEETARWVADRVEAKTGFSIEYTTVEGNFFTGHFAFSDATLGRDQADKAFIDAKIDSVEANLSLIDFLFGDRVLDFARVDGAEIRFKSRKSPQPSSENENKPTFDIKKFTSPDRREGVAISVNVLEQLELPRYAINHLLLSGITIDITDNAGASPTRYPVSIQKMEAKPIRSLFVWFDILFRSNLEATIDGAKARIVNTVTASDARHTEWTIEDVSAQTLASLAGGPFSMFQSGTIDISVSDDWTFKNRDSIQMDWLLRVEDAEVALPASTPKLLRPLAQVTVDNINNTPSPWEFDFQLELSEAQFKGAASLNARQIWRDAVPVVLQQLSDLFDTEPETIKQKTRNAFDRFKDYLEERNENEND